MEGGHCGSEGGGRGGGGPRPSYLPQEEREGLQPHSECRGIVGDETGERRRTGPHNSLSLLYKEVMTSITLQPALKTFSFL